LFDKFSLILFALANLLYLGVIVSVAIGCLMFVWQGFSYFRTGLKKSINFSDFIIVIPFVVFMLRLTGILNFFYGMSFHFGRVVQK